jgi:hypothetical protein
MSLYYSCKFCQASYRFFKPGGGKGFCVDCGGELDISRETGQIAENAIKASHLSALVAPIRLLKNPFASHGEADDLSSFVKEAREARQACCLLRRRFIADSDHVLEHDDDTFTSVYGNIKTEPPMPARPTPVPVQELDLNEKPVEKEIEKENEESTENKEPEKQGAELSDQAKLLMKLRAQSAKAKDEKKEITSSKEYVAVPTEKNTDKPLEKKPSTVEAFLVFDDEGYDSSKELPTENLKKDTAEIKIEDELNAFAKEALEDIKHSGSQAMRIQKAIEERKRIKAKKTAENDTVKDSKAENKKEKKKEDKEDEKGKSSWFGSLFKKK